MGRRSEHTRDEMRDMALSAASVIVEQDGYQALTTRRVAQAIGYTVGSLYLMFDGLDDLILQLNAQTLEDMYQSLAPGAMAARTPHDRVLALGMGYIRFAREHHHRWRLLFEYQRPDNLPVWMQGKVDRLFYMVEVSIGELLPRISEHERRLAARALQSGVHGVCILGLSGRLDISSGITVEALVTSLVNNYLVGLTTAHAAKN